MNFAFLEAAAENTTTSSIWMLVLVVVMGAAVYLLMIRPQKKKEKEATNLRNSIEVGDEVTTIGGIVGRVVSIKEDTFIIETAGERSRMRFRRWAIQDVGKLNLDSTADVEPSVTKPDKKKDKAKED